MQRKFVCSIITFYFGGSRSLPPPADPAQKLTPVIVVFAAHTKQFKDSNFNVLKAAFLGIKLLLEAAHTSYTASGSRGNPAALATVLPPAVEKLSDRKLQVDGCGFLMWAVFCGHFFRNTILPQIWFSLSIAPLLEGSNFVLPFSMVSNRSVRAFDLCAPFPPSGDHLFVADDGIRSFRAIVGISQVIVAN